jgi:hypothetical protein
MILPLLIFFTTSIICLVRISKTMWPLWRVRQQLEYMPDLRWREFKIGILQNSSAIFDDTDSADARQLKQEYLTKLEVHKATVTKALYTALIGLGITVVACIVQLIFEGKP